MHVLVGGDSPPMFPVLWAAPESFSGTQCETYRLSPRSDVKVMIHNSQNLKAIKEEMYTFFFAMRGKWANNTKPLKMQRVKSNI